MLVTLQYKRIQKHFININHLTYFDSSLPPESDASDVDPVILEALVRRSPNQVLLAEVRLTFTFDFLNLLHHRLEV